MKFLFNLMDKIHRGYQRKRVKVLLSSKRNIKCYGKVNLLNTNVTLGDGCVLYPGVSFEGNGFITIGNNVKIGTNTIIYASKSGGVNIGDNSSIAADSYIIDSNHGTNKRLLICDQPLDSKKIEIGKDVWIGANVVIAKGAILEDGAVIGANSFVNKKIDQNGIAVGCPARIIKYGEE